MFARSQYEKYFWASFAYKNNTLQWFFGRTYYVRGRKKWDKIFGTRHSRFCTTFESDMWENREMEAALLWSLKKAVLSVFFVSQNLFFWRVKLLKKLVIKKSLSSISVSFYNIPFIYALCTHSLVESRVSNLTLLSRWLCHKTQFHRSSYFNIPNCATSNYVFLKFYVMESTNLPICQKKVYQFHFFQVIRKGIRYINFCSKHLKVCTTSGGYKFWNGCRKFHDFFGQKYKSPLLVCQHFCDQS